MAVSITFDVEADLHKNTYLGVTKGLARVLKILDKHKIKATFFTTCDALEKNPKAFQRLKKQGHEIALHGYEHVRFDDLTSRQKENQLKKAITVFRKHLNQKPRGFRAPQHSIDNETLKLLEKYDFKYDSSKAPLNILQFFFFPRKLELNLEQFFSIPVRYKIGKLTEIPASSLLVPFVSLVPRIFPRALQRAYVSFLDRAFRDIVFYAHSWDFIELKDSRLDREFSYTNVISNLDYLIALLKKKGHQFKKMEELA